MAARQTERRMGRPPKYDWDDKRETCYRLYVEEKRSANKIIQYFTEHLKVDAKELPSRKGFLRQFVRWGFPSHRQRLAPDQEARATARVKDLWERNVSQKDIKHTLEDEGYHIGKHEFALLWKKNGLRLRNNQGYKASGTPLRLKRKRQHAPEETSQAADVSGAREPPDLSRQAARQAALQSQCPGSGTEVTVPDVEGMTVRARRLYELQVESNRKLHTGKRRRRIRGFGPLPPDASGSAPRYASETSLDECKAYLHLSNEMYITIRADFELICNTLGIVKKTQCAEGVWEEGKNRLVRDNLHLSAMLHPLQPDQDKKSIALDCICADVTKRLRASRRVVTIAEANNSLNLNPAESKAVRRSLYEILENCDFESRLICGEDRWSQIHQEWLRTSESLQQAVADGDPVRSRSVDVLCRDTLKRYRGDSIRRGERAVVNSASWYGPGPGPARAVTVPKPLKATLPSMACPTAGPEDPTSFPIREPRARAAVEGRGYYAQPSGNLLMSLVQTTGNIDFDIDPSLATDAVPAAAPDRSKPTIPAYFSLAAGSNIVGNLPRMWLAILTSVTLESLHKAATSRLGAARVDKVHGLIMNSAGVEERWLIETQDELAAYLQAAGEKPKFTVLIQAGYA